MWVIHTRTIIKMVLLALFCGLILTSACNAVPKAQGTIEDVTSVQVRPLSLSLAVNEEGNPWISFYSLKEGESDGRLMAITKENAKWTPYLIDDVGNVGLYSSMGFDNLNVPWIAYYDVTNKSVLIAYPVPSVYDEKNKTTIKPEIINDDPTSIWVHEGVFAASGADVGKYISIAFDNRGEPGISAYDSENTIPMFFALNASGANWIPHFPSNTKETGEFTSITFDTSNEPWISYVDDKNRDFIVSHKTGKTWVVETVDSLGDVGAYNSISTDPDGNIGVSYYDYTNRGLKYASRVGGSWKVESVWKGIIAVSGEKYDLDVGSFSSLVFDKKGIPYITFYAASTGELMGAVKSGDKWIKVVIDSPKEKITPVEGSYQGVGSYSSAKLLPSGDKIGITYYDWDNGIVKYAELKTSEFLKGESTTKDTKTTKSTQKSITYTDKNFTFTPLNDWNAKNIFSDEAWQWIPYGTSNNGTFSVLSGIIKEKNVNIKNRTELGIAVLKNLYPDFVLTQDPTKTKVGGRDAIKFGYTYSNELGKWKQQDIYVSGKNNLFEIMYFAPPEFFDTEIAGIEKVIETIKFK